MVYVTIYFISVFFSSMLQTSAYNDYEQTVDKSCCIKKRVSWAENGEYVTSSLKPSIIKFEKELQTQQYPKSSSIKGFRNISEDNVLLTVMIYRRTKKLHQARADLKRLYNQVQKEIAQENVLCARIKTPNVMIESGVRSAQKQDSVSIEQGDLVLLLYKKFVQ